MHVVEAFPRKRPSQPLAALTALSTAPSKHSRYPSDAECDEKPRPSTVSGVPPSARTTAGDTLLTDADAWNV